MPKIQGQKTSEEEIFFNVFKPYSGLSDGKYKVDTGKSGNQEDLEI